MSYPVEQIPNCDLLFKWFPRSKCDDDGRPHAEAFQAKGAGMSTSWSRYSSAEECRAMCKRPTTLGVVSLAVADVRSLLLGIQHSPRDLAGSWVGFPRQAQAHTDVIGADDLEIQIRLRDLAAIVIKADPPGIGDAELRKQKKIAERVR